MSRPGAAVPRSARSAPHLAGHAGLRAARSSQDGILPGGSTCAGGRRGWLSTLRRASAPRPLGAMDWVNVCALAVNEENAAGGRVVTAPTNGAAGIMPAVAHFYDASSPVPARGDLPLLAHRGRHRHALQGECFHLRGRDGLPGRGRRGLLDGGRGLVAALVEPTNRSNMPPRSAWSTISDLTCDPIAGLVQIPCIERNAMGSVKAINAARWRMRGDGDAQGLARPGHRHHAPNRKSTCQSIYKETSQGGLAVNVPDC